jgi:integrase
VLTFAFREKLIELNPFDYYEATNRPANVITRDDVFHFEDLQKLREGNYEHQALYNFFEFIFFTGLRPNEAAALKMKQVYDEPDPYILAFLPKKKITIQNTLSTGKFKSVKTPTSHRTLTLHPLARKCLDRHAKYRNIHYEKDNIHHDYVFFFDDDFKPMDCSTKIRKRYMTLHARSGLVSRIPPKNFRHSFAVAMLIGGASPFFIAQYMGHADLQMLYKIYGDMINQDAEMRELQKFWVDSTYEESQRDELERENLLPDLSW